MNLIVLAGGKGTRLQSVISDVAKPMAPINGKPFLEFLLNQLCDYPFERVVLSVGHLANSITSYFGDEFKNTELIYSHETTPLGTGGATLLALQKCETDPTLVVNGDTYVEFDMPTLAAEWRDKRKTIILASLVNDTSRFGALNFDDAGTLIGYGEKTQIGQGYASAGCYVLERSDFDGHHVGERFSIENAIIERKVRSGKVSVFKTDFEFIDIGVPADYARAQELQAFST